jgi:hypothetical protein
MKSSEIQHYVTAHSDIQSSFLGIFSADTIPENFPVHNAAIVNTGKQHEAGIHWYLLIRRSEQHFELFDSLGTSESEVRKLLNFSNSQARCTHNKTRLQCQGSRICAQFCLYFLTVRLWNYDIKFDDVINLYLTANPVQNEQIVTRFFATDELFELDYDA